MLNFKKRPVIPYRCPWSKESCIHLDSLFLVTDIPCEECEMYRATGAIKIDWRTVVIYVIAIILIFILLLL